MEYTTNLNLKKPDINEYYNVVEQENENADIIDEAIGKLNSDVGTEVLTTEAQDCKGAINELNKKVIKYIVIQVEVNSSGEVNLRQYLGANKLPVFVIGSTGYIANGTGSNEYLPYILGDTNVNTIKTIGVYYFEI